MLKIYQHQLRMKCLRCNSDNKTLVHVLQCPDIKAQQVWKTEVEKILMWILENKGCAIMAQVIGYQITINIYPQLSFLHSYKMQSPNKQL